MPAYVMNSTTHPKNNKTSDIFDKLS